jgi:HPt (histidine-containing phosphotransfer) domain-containing protein
MSSYADRPACADTDPPLVLDRGLLDTFSNEICGGNIEIIDDLVEIYLQSLDDLIGQIVSAWNREDYIILRRAAHSLKSSSRIFGAHLLAENCEILEKAALTGELADAPMLIEHLEKQRQQMHLLLATEFARMKQDTASK